MRKFSLVPATLIWIAAVATGVALAECPDKAAFPTGQGGSTSTPDTMSCTDGTSCGGTTTYNPIVTTCETASERCCVPQEQYSYTARRECRDTTGGGGGAISTTCKTITTQNSGPVTVFVTVGCNADGTCAETPEFDPPGDPEGSY